MLYTIIFSLLTIGNLVQCGILDCENQYLSGNPVSLEGNLFNCANTADGHGNCYGPGRVYFGDKTSWTYQDLEEGESISCINTAFGCDPVPGYPKQCYITLYQSVEISFFTLKILKTNDDGINGDGVEEWHIVNDGTDQQITMNVDFKDEYNSWNGCNFDITQLLHDGTDCKPPAATEDANGFYECQMYGNTDLPVIVVKPNVYESGLKYTFNIVMGDYDANGEVFDNGPTFDFSYTEPDHKSISDLRNNGPITRYFTRSGPEGRKARIYLTYRLIESDTYPFEDDGSDMDTCN
eukprot:CAMPEP_0201592250 /NCGR_PEP_ID=MMETSP0190_2-20130828/190199_1 /ASSEMBLY_ACC=CAM_ASM_000263 /TAXON_ID=37353 /ORGANISM="Rosalina sp." /LENGTH=293 /DNA_ID=CAMNT_0048050939 /DNA_START=110 /DNA_END=991 /DNA_ORIENTATION=-